jgi:ankyrin repeat protein
MGSCGSHLKEDENLRKAAQHGDLKKVQDYIKTYGDVNMAAKDKHGFTALHLAAHDGHLSVVKYLCEQGADKEATGHANRKLDFKMTPLHKAAINGHLPVVQYLCEHGADMDARDDHRMTPLHRAAWNGWLPVVQYFCEHGDDKESKDRNGYTPLHWATKNSHREVVEFLHNFDPATFVPAVPAAVAPAAAVPAAVAPAAAVRAAFPIAEKEKRPAEKAAPTQTDDIILNLRAQIDAQKQQEA